jgi:methylmalonyl-CoA mutase cobalamin-binding subunit
MSRRRTIFPEDRLPDAAELMARGRERARTIQVVPGPFLSATGAASEAAYKRQAVAEGRIMQHAQIGYRDLEKSCRAWAEIHASLAARGRRVDRYGICLDWVMGLPRDRRKAAPHGTGLILERPEDFSRLAGMAPVAPHFGDFIMGFPAAVENTAAALLAGATAIGNLGQYFTFRLPAWDDDVACTAATVEALGLIAAQEREVLVHSNLDDGFAALFTDITSVLGLVLIEKHMVEDLIGAPLSHCWGHHFSDQVKRLAFHLALAEVNPTPGTMVYGNTISYAGGAGENYAALAAYLAIDIAGQQLQPTGHALNPVPVTENSRIPDIDEVIEAQLFAGRLIERNAAARPLVDPAPAEAMAADIVAGGRRFAAQVLAGLQEMGVDTANPLEMLLALRRLGAKRLEQDFGAGEPDKAAPRGRRPLVAASLAAEIAHVAATRLARVPQQARAAFAARRPRLMVATSDVHEHGKLALEAVLGELGADLIDGGVSVDPDDLAAAAIAAGAEAILVSTYNGVALDYFSALKAALAAEGSTLPVLIGGRLNQVPVGTNTSLPVDVSGELAAAGALVCGEIEGAVDALLQALAAKTR